MQGRIVPQEHLECVFSCRQAASCPRKIFTRSRPENHGGVTLGCRNELCEPLRLPRRGEDRTPPTARGVESLGVRSEKFNGDVDETLVQKADDDASLAGHCGVDGVAGEEIAE